MADQEEGRWDVGVKGGKVSLERISDGDERLLADSLTPQEARALAGLLTKFADKADQNGSTNDGDSDEADESDEANEDAADQDDADENDDADKAKKDEDDDSD